MAISFPTNPVDGQTYVYNNISYTWFSSKQYWKTAKVIWSGTQSTVSFSTGSLASSASYTGSSAFYNGYLIASVTTSGPAWVRVYASSAASAADSSRAIDTNPDPNSGVLLEIVSDGANTYYMNPMVYAANRDSPVNNLVYVRITNQSTISATITVDLSLIKMGA